jgi:hypothetical protein
MSILGRVLGHVVGEVASDTVRAFTVPPRKSLKISDSRVVGLCAEAGEFLQRCGRDPEFGRNPERAVEAGVDLWKRAYGLAGDLREKLSPLDEIKGLFYAVGDVSTGLAIFPGAIMILPREEQLSLFDRFAATVETVERPPWDPKVVYAAAFDFEKTRRGVLDVCGKARHLFPCDPVEPPGGFYTPSNTPLPQGYPEANTKPRGEVPAADSNLTASGAS